MQPGNGGAPLPLSAFLDGSAAGPIVDIGDVVDAQLLGTAAASANGLAQDSPPVGMSDEVAAPGCLRTPQFLGCHLIASLGEELTLDGGRLRIWCGCLLYTSPSPRDS